MVGNVHNIQYFSMHLLRYFAAFHYQFQFYRAMCLAAGMDEDDFDTFSSKCSTGRAVWEGGPQQATPSVQPLWI